ncbi:MAG TPA: DUF2459 domain-containing protein [Cellvibrio sp.]|nr:DUF2459 domain-containing protein [Cellvibrio sp.]
MMAGIGKLIIGLLLFMQVACSTLPDTKKIPTHDTSHQIHFIYREWHTSILLPAEAVIAHSRYMKEEAEGKLFIRVGWGDGVYFTGKNKSMGTATKALFISQYSALQLLTYAQDPFVSIPADTHVPLAITGKGLRRLIRYIDNSFVVDKQKNIVSLPAYGDGVGSFYQARERYGLFNNCNTWTGRALQSAGLPVKSRLHLTAQSVFDQAKAISLYQIEKGYIHSGKSGGGKELPIDAKSPK